MLRAMYFEEAYKKGILADITLGFILSVKTPDMDNRDTMNDPILVEIISYSGVKAVIPTGAGLKYQAQGNKMYCMIEPTSYTEKHIEPAFRKQNTTGFMPFRFADCDIFLTKDMRLNIMIPRKAQECFDSFTVTLPEKGDLCILYMPFDKDIEGVVIPFMQTNFHDILCKMLGVRDVDSKIISRKLMDVVKKSNKTGFEKA